jgi:hypothetical protein
MSNETLLWSDIAMKCYHCGNKTIMRLIAQYTKKAHADDVEFDKQTVNQLIDFTQIILDYMYTLPAKIIVAQNRLAKISEVEKEKKEDE